MNSLRYKFPLEPLKYSYDALEPYIDALTMQLHHDRHLKTYVDNLNASLEGSPEYQSWPLEKLITGLGTLPESLRKSVARNGGGVFNHNFYFEALGKFDFESCDDSFVKVVEGRFGNFEGFKEQLRLAALDVFGSGYAWLIVDKTGRLEVISTANQDTPLVLDLMPLLCVDVWEHAYYLKNYNKRVDYIKNLFEVISWDVVQKRYDSVLSEK